MVLSKVTHYTTFNLDFLNVFLQHDFVTSLKLSVAKDTVFLEYCFGFFSYYEVKRFRSSRNVVQTTFLSFIFPLVRITVSFETNFLRRLNILTKYVNDSNFFLFTFLNDFINFSFEFDKSISYDSVKNSHWPRRVSRRTYRAELKLVTSEGKRRSTVTVCVIKDKLRNTVDTQFHVKVISFRDLHITIVLKFFKDIIHRLTKEGRHDCRRSFVSTKTVIVTC